jgi:hypothetical protein
MSTPCRFFRLREDYLREDYFSRSAIIASASAIAAAP